MSDTYQPNLDAKVQGVLDQLQAEVHGLQSQIDAFGKRLAAAEAVLPRSMTTDELWKKKPDVPLGADPVPTLEERLAMLEAKARSNGWRL